MIASNHNRPLQFLPLDKIIYGRSKFGPFGIAQPANSRRQALELNPLFREFQPARQGVILWKQLQGELIGPGNVFGITAQRHPAKRAAAFTKQRANVFRNKSWNIERVGHTSFFCLRPNIVSVVERDRAFVL